MDDNLINRPSVALGLPSYPDVSFPDSGNADIIPDKTAGETWMDALRRNQSRGIEELPLSQTYIGERYDMVRPGTDYEEMAGQQQTTGEKAARGIKKFGVLTGTTFVGSTVGMVNGLIEWEKTGNAISFIDNPTTRWVDEVNSSYREKLAHYYTQAEKDASWYSPKKLFSANFFWDGIITNLGFSAGMALSALATAGALGAANAYAGTVAKSLGLIKQSGKLFSAGRAAEVLSAQETAMAGAKGAQGAARMYTGIGDLSKKFLGQYNQLNRGQRYLVNGMSIQGESAFESYHNMNEFRNQKIEEYKQANGGKAPTGEALDAINKAAEGVAKISYIGNAAVLFTTASIQLPRILGSNYALDKTLANGVVREIDDVIEKAGEYVVKPRKGGWLLNFGKNFKPGGALTYTFSASEGFEEGAQYAITIGTQHYFDKKYNDLPNDVTDSIIEGITETLGTNEGMENILIGGISGAMMMGYGRAREESQKKKDTAQAIREFNENKLSDFTREASDSVKRGAYIQAQRDQAVVDGNIVDADDLEKDYMINYLMPRVKYGRFDLVMSDIDDFASMAMTDEGFSQLQEEGKVSQTDTRENFIQRLTMFRQTAENMKTMYESLNVRYAGQLTDDKKRKYSDDTIDKMVYATTKIADYDRRMGVLSEKLSMADIDTLGLIKDLVEGNVEKFNEASSLIKSKDNINKDDIGEALDSFGEIVLRRKKFMEEFEDMKLNPSKYHETKITDLPKEKQDPEIKTVKVKTKTGEKDIEIGVEYFLGKVVEHDKNGNEVYRAPRLKILAVSDDGKTITIQDNKGVRDIDASLLEDYKLGKVSVVKNNPIARFFIENWNTVTWQKLKGGKKRPGRLEYDTDKNQLYFTYRVGKKGKGYTKSIPISMLSFEPAKSYYKEGLFSFGRKLTADEQGWLDEQKKIMSAPEAAIIYQLNTKEGREKVITDLYNELKERQKKTTELIEQKKKDVQEIIDDIEKLQSKIESTQKPEMVTKKGNVFFKPSIKKAMSSVNELNNAKAEIEIEIQELETESDELYSMLNYMEDIKDNLSELPSDIKDIIYQLEYEVELIKEGIADTAKQISILQRIIDPIQKAIDTAIDILVDLISEFKSKYPKVPARIGQEWVDFVKSNPNFLKKKPDYAQELSDLEKLIAETEDFEIAPNKEKVDNLIPLLKSLEHTYEQYIHELPVKEAILSKFQEAYNDYQKSGIEEKIISNNEKVIKAALGTADKKSVPTKESIDEREFEPNPKKADDIIWRATMGVNRGKPYQERANKFGFNLNKFKNRKSIRGVQITSENEKIFGLEGFVDMLVNDAESQGFTVDRDKIIALVMVDVSGEEAVLVNEDGQPITENTLDEIIFQVYPLEELAWGKEYDNASMFRKTTSEQDKESIKTYYKKFRDDIIKQAPNQQTKDDFSYHTIEASFGFPDYEYVMDENNEPVKNERGVNQINYNKRTPVEDAALVTEDEFDNAILIHTVTLDGDVMNGTTHYRGKKGRSFLRKPNGDVPLQSRKHTKKEADTIFRVIHLLAKYMVDPKVGLLNKEGKINESCLPLIQWLESVVYWHPKGEPGYSSIFWKKNEEGKFVLELSGKGETFPFTPSSLMDNRDIITGIIQEMYAHVKKDKSINLNEPYVEFVSVDDADNIEKRRWLNYQTYLLSKTFIGEDPNDPDNGKPRGDIPLTTVIKPVDSVNKVNRVGIYFYTEDNKGEVEIKGPQKNIIAGKPKKKEEEFTGEKKTHITKNGYRIIYTVDKDGNMKILPGGDINTVFTITVANLKNKNPKASDEKLQSEARKLIENRIKTDLSEQDKTEEGEDSGVSVAQLRAMRRGIKPEEEEEQQQEEEEAEEEEKEEQGGLTIKELRARNEKLRNQVDELIKDADDETVETGEEYREIADTQEEKFETEQWPRIEKWLKANFPSLPVYRVKNIIRATNGKQAWGMFKNGAIYVYENAEVGTIYHEVFEGVWKMMTSPEEQLAIENEFRQRRGTFIDRPTGKLLNYSEAAPQQIKEQLAEEFRDYVHNKKIPPKPNKGRPFIVKLFADLVSLIKRFFLGDKSSLVEEMFNNINTGFYKDRIPYESNLSFATKGIIDVDEAFASDEDELRQKTISDRVMREVLDTMTYHTVFNLIQKDENLFNLESHINTNKEELYESLKRKVAATTKGMPMEKRQKLMTDILHDWDVIVERHTEYLRQYNIEFDENDEMQLRNEDKIRESDYVEANKIDHLKKSSAAMKMLLSTIIEVDINGNKKRQPETGAYKLIPLNRVWVTLLNALHNSISVEDMIVKLSDLAKRDPNYRGLYKRILKREWSDNVNVSNVDYSHIVNKHGGMLLSSFYSLFRKNNPEVKTVTIFDNGEISVGDTHLSTFASQLRDDYVNNMVYAAKNKSKYFIYDSKKKVYSGNKESISNTPMTDISAMVKFLGEIGIKFNEKDVNKLSFTNLNKFKESVVAIRQSIKEGSEIATISGRVLKMNSRLLDLGYIQASINHGELDTTFYNVNNERVQSFIGTNPASDLYNFLSQLDEFSEENLIGTPYYYLWTDSFAQGSNIRKRMFGRSGKRSSVKDASKLLSVAYVSGIDNLQKGKRKESSKLNYKERIMQEINLNIEGYYLNLVPGDASMEHAIYMGEAVSLDNIRGGKDSIHLMFKEYFLSEIELVKESDIRESSMANLPENRRRNAKEMRFFKSILGDELHSKIIADISKPAVQLYNDYQSRINLAVDKFIASENKKVENTLTAYGLLYVNEEGAYVFQNINFSESRSKTELNNKLTYLTVNYMMANIELHKLLYADPYQYADELKRMKNFQSPRQGLINNSPRMNALLNRIWNRGFKKGDRGWTDFMADYFRTATYKDIQGISQDIPQYMENWKETDGGGMITFSANRNFRIRVGDWNDNEERQYIHDMGYEELIEKGATEYELLEYEENNPGIQSAYHPIKPIVSGGKYSDTTSFNNIVLDKFALYPMSRRLVDAINRAGNKKTSNLVLLYEKMRNEKIDYVVFENSRKVGAASPQSFYNPGGSFNSSPYPSETLFNVPFSAISVQSEVPSKEENNVTRGSQITKIVTMDFMEAGIPIDFKPNDSFESRYKTWINLSLEQKKNESPLFAEIHMNQQLLEGMITAGYYTVLERLGITETYDRATKQRKYELSDENREVAGETLRDEMLKREVSDNISDALRAFIEGKSVLEATPAYQQIRNIIYSIADKEVMSPKINGSMKVQIPSTAFEEFKLAEVTLPNGKKGFVSDTLKFYEKDGKRVCELMIPRWFKSKLSDAELLDFLNKTDEGQKILSGVAFRIPTQKQNSIESFVIKQFLPKEFGDVVVVPSAIVHKTGSDFDIDKLTIYLKNVLSDSKGLQLIPYFGIGNEARKKMKEFYVERADVENEAYDVLMRLLKQENRQKIFGEMAIGTADRKTYDKYLPRFKEWFADIMVDDRLPVRAIENIYMRRVEKLGKRFEELSNEDLQDEIAERKSFIWYKESLQNRYIESMEFLTSHESNFDRLITPNSAEELKNIAKEIAAATVGSSFEYENVGNMLDRTFMSRLRHAFVSGKYAIGIAAVNQTNNSLNQRQLTYVDPTRIRKLSNEDNFWLNDGKLKFRRFNKITIEGIGDVATLSKPTNAEGKYISDIISQFIDGYVDISKGPWIMEMGATPNVTSTWLFLVKTGVPIKDVAYFMNQPIIRDYLKSIEVAGYSWLFMSNFVEDMLSTYKTSDNALSIEQLRTMNFTIPSTSNLKEMMKMKLEEMTDEQKLNQQFMLLEFVKYAKMAEHMFHVTQGSNFDTANFNDFFLVFKKLKQLEKAQQSIISNVDDMMKNSFIGKLAETIKYMRDALATILESDKMRVRTIIQKVLTSYVDMSDRDFIKIAQKAVSDIIDYAVQTNEELNRHIYSIMIEKGGVATRMKKFMDTVSNDATHPLYGNQIIGVNGVFRIIPSSRAGDNLVNNASIRGLQNKVYDQNQLIGAFREIREYLKGKTNLYEEIVEFAILQSGLSRSSISFTSVIPYEDFEKVYHKTLSKLNNIGNLDAFFDLGVFHRNNWNNDDIVPQMRAAWIPTQNGKRYNPAMWLLNNPKLKNAISKKHIPPMITIRQFTKESNFDYVVYSWESQEEMLPANWKQIYKGMSAISAVKKMKAEMRANGDYSYINKGLFRKVKDSYGNPLETGYTNTKSGEFVPQFLYVAVNAWGDGRKANEFYDVAKKSVIDNGFIKVDEISNIDIIAVDNGQKTFNDRVTQKTVPYNVQYSGMPEFNKLPSPSPTPTMTYAGVGSRQTPANILKQMTEVAKELESRGYTLNTGVTFRGKKEGADKAFADGTRRVNLFSPEKQGSRKREQSIAKEVHPNPNALTEGALRLMARNTNQVFGDNLKTPVDFVLFWAKESSNPLRPQGGTGQAVEMARRKGIPTINMADSNWRQQFDDVIGGRTVEDIDYEEVKDDWESEDNTCPAPF